MASCSFRTARRKAAATRRHHPEGLALGGKFLFKCSDLLG